MSTDTDAGLDIKVLVVDDSPNMRTLLRGILGGKYELAFAADGVEGVERYDGFAPDVIVLDLLMPRLDGFGVIEHVRRQRRDADVFIVVLTAVEETEEKARALNLGANDFLVKPFDKGELMARMGVAARQVRLTRKLREAHDVIAAEIELVARLQQKILPASSPYIQGVRVERLYEPSGLASGDYYDFFSLDEYVLRVVVADVSGHEARAAFIMAIVRTLVHTSSADLTSLLRQINTHLMEIIHDEGDFVTILAADVDFSRRKMKYVNAGHCPGILVGEEASPTLVMPTAPLLGLLDDAYAVREIDLPKKPGLMLFTDGCYEWKMHDGHIFGLDAFLDLATETIASGGPVLERLMAELSRLAGSTSVFRDDLTALWVTGSGTRPTESDDA
jgi:sigma-B regulation protein RsbU (phosphoserine phosphatase)